MSAADPLLRKELTTAVFVDFENLALGVEEDKKGRFEIELVLKRLLERGRIVFKRAYCDWTRFKEFMHEFHRLGFEMVDIPSSRVSGKNSADIRMVVDAIDLCYSKSHIDTFVLLTGDSDFSPLVSIAQMLLRISPPMPVSDVTEAIRFWRTTSSLRYALK